MAATVKAPWAQFIDVNVEVLSTATGAGWTPVVCSIQSLHVAGGRAEWSASIDPSLMSAVFDNVDGSIDISSGWKIRVTTGHVPVFNGRIFDATRSANPDGSSRVSVRASDDLGSLATTFLEGLDVTNPLAAIGIGDTFKERVNRILDLAGWPANMRALDDTLQWPLEGTWLDLSALDELRIIAQSVGGWVFLDRAGKISTGFPTDVGSPTWILFAKHNPQVQHPICVSSFQQSNNLEFVVNDIFLRHHGQGMSYTMTKDVPSMTKYGVRSYVQEGLQNLHHLSDLAVGILANGKDPRNRLKAVTVPIVDPQSGSLVESFRMGDRIQLMYDNGHGDAFDNYEGFTVGWALDLDGVSGELTLVTGHPLDVRPQSSTSSVGGGGGGGTGQPGATGPVGPQGPRGATWFQDSGPPTSTKPPPPTGGFIVGDSYMDKNTGKLYIYTSTGWHADGVDLTGPEGPRGIQGIQGTVGPRGSVWSHTATMPPDASLAPAGGWREGDQILHEPDGELFVYKSGAWSDEGVSILGPQGPPGIRGPQGHSIHVKGTVATKTDLDSITPPPADGDAHFVVDTGDLYVWSGATNAWVDMGHIQGPEGQPGHIGPTGPRGANGTPGATGPKGDTGAQGPIGPKGATGQISDAHGDARYLRLDASNDPVTGALKVTNTLQVTKDINGDAFVYGTSGFRGKSRPGGWTRGLEIVNQAQTKALGGLHLFGTGDVLHHATFGPTYALPILRVDYLTKKVHVGWPYRANSEVRNISSGTSAGMPSDSEPGDIHLQHG